MMRIFRYLLHFSYLRACVRYQYVLRSEKGRAFTSSPARRDNEARLLLSRTEILFEFVDRSTASTIATLAYEYSRWNGSPGDILSRLVVIVHRGFANVDCPRRTLIRDSFEAFHRNTFV